MAIVASSNRTRSFAGWFFVIVALLAAPSFSQGDIETRIQELITTQERLEQELAAVREELTGLQEEAREAQPLESDVLFSGRLDARARLFRNSDFSGATYQWVPSGTMVDILDFETSMVQIAYGEHTGWIRGTALEEAGEVAIKKIRDGQRRARGSEPFLITGLTVKGPDSAAGVGAVVRLMMLDESLTLKYLELTYTPYNAVGDQVASEHRGGLSRSKHKVTGPLNFADGETLWGGDPIWYNPSIHCIKINRVDVEYMNGERHSYIRELSKVLDSAMSNDCSYRPKGP